MHRSSRFAPLLALLLGAAFACARVPSELEALAASSQPLDLARFPADTVRARPLAAGVVHRYYWSARGPWAVHVLDVDRTTACWALAAAKSTSTARGRTRTSDILAQRRGDAVAAVNADFFLFAPPGVPVGAHVEDGRVISGPVARPVLAIDSADAITIDTLSSPGWLQAPGFSLEITGWNRPLAGGLSLFDARWGTQTDTATGAVEVIVSARPRGVVLAVDTLPHGAAVPPNGVVLVAGRTSPVVVRAQLAALQPGVDTLTTAIALAPIHPREAVGGFPILVRDGEEVPRLDSAGGARFGPVRHPRTAVGVAAGGQRIFLVVVDGRQAPYSDGMTLHELAQLMLALGADEAINLDGGGSSAMVVVDRRAVRVVNRPSDAQGERAVGNALIVERCRS